MKGYIILILAVFISFGILYLGIGKDGQHRADNDPPDVSGT